MVAGSGTAPADRSIELDADNEPELAFADNVAVALVNELKLLEVIVLLLPSPAAMIVSKNVDRSV